MKKRILISLLLYRKRGDIMVSRILDKYLDVSDFPLDEQLLLMSDPTILNSINIETLLAQFKYCKRKGIDNKAFKVLRNHLVSLLGEDVVKNLEVVRFE